MPTLIPGLQVLHHLDHQTNALESNISHGTSAHHLPNPLAHHSGLGEETQMQYDPLSPNEINMVFVRSYGDITCY